MAQPYAGPATGPAVTPLPGRVLVMADDPNVGDVIGRHLERAGLAVSVAVVRPAPPSPRPQERP